MSSFYEIPKWSSTSKWKLQLGLTIFFSLALIGSLFLTWFYTVDSVNGVMGLNSFSTGFEFWAFLTVIAMVVSLLMNLNRPSRIGAVFLAWFGSWWLLLSVASLTARNSFILAASHFYQIPNLVLTTADSNYEGIRAFQVGEAWYVVLFTSLAMLVGSVLIIREANK